MINNIVVCVGDSCYSKGSCEVAKKFLQLIREYNLEGIMVNASFCMQHCSPEGVSVQIGDEQVNGVTPRNVDDVFKKYVLSKVACLSR